MSSSIRLREQRAAVMDSARAILERAKREGRDITREEDREFDRRVAEVDRLREQVDAAERADRLAARPPRTLAERDRAEVEAFSAWLGTGEVRNDLAAAQGRAAALHRDTVTGTDAKGGYLVAPTAVSADIISTIDDLVFVRRLA